MYGVDDERDLIRFSASSLAINIYNIIQLKSEDVADLFQTETNKYCDSRPEKNSVKKMTIFIARNKKQFPFDG